MRLHCQSFRFAEEWRVNVIGNDFVLPQCWLMRRNLYEKGRGSGLGFR